jgi:hypothetical protein
VNRGFLASTINPPMCWKYLEIEGGVSTPMAVSRSDGEDWVYGYSGDVFNMNATNANTAEPNIRIACVVDVGNVLHAWSAGFRHQIEF